MLTHSTSTFNVITFMALITTAATGNLSLHNQECLDLLISQSPNNGVCVSSGAPIMFYNHSSEVYSKSTEIDKPIGKSSLDAQQRFKFLSESFKKNNQSFPQEKNGYFLKMANTLSRIPFVDNVSSYNDDDETIDTVVKLPNGMKLSISQFLDDNVEAPVVFSLHREKTLLVSDELPIEDIVETLNQLIEKQANGISA